jgi:uncharacterized NAD(P)/FAD-binding protein YdhS
MSATGLKLPLSFWRSSGETSNMHSFVLTIIGLGPRGLVLLDRVIEAYRCREAEYQLKVHLVDPGEPGQGVHRHTQPNHLQTNTPGSMLTIVPNEAIQGAPPRSTGPSLTEWARLRGYRRIGSDYRISESCSGAEITEEDSLPRSILGEYLSWHYNRTTENLPEGISLTYHKHRATDVTFCDNTIVSIELETGEWIRTDFLFVASGHGSNQPNLQESYLEQFVSDHAAKNSKLRFIRNPYTSAVLGNIDPHATVAVQGFGLTAYDVVSELTVGRGGEFIPHPTGFEYRKSGLEPRLLIFSRRGVPFSARAINQRQPGKLYQAHFFNVEAVTAIRNRALKLGGTGQLDFDRDLLPLLVKDMAYAYSNANGQTSCDPSEYEPTEQDRITIENLMHPLRSLQFDDIDDYRQFVLKYLSDDLSEAKRGNVAGPIKAAVEVIRTSRPCLRLAVDFGGLTSESHERFDAHHVPMMNHLALGAPLHRNQELLALFAAGVLDVAAGPNPTIEADAEASQFVIKSRFERSTSVNFVDVLVAARIASSRPEEDSSAFFRNLLASGAARPYYNGTYHPGGLDIDRQNRLMTKNGTPVRNTWVVGYPAEGPNFFTYALPLPGINSRPVLDADLCVLGLFRDLSEKCRQRSALSDHSDQELSLCEILKC